MVVAKLVNETLMAAPAPPTCVALSCIVAGVISKKPMVSLTIPVNVTVIEFLLRAINDTSVRVSVYVSPPMTQDFTTPVPGSVDGPLIEEPYMILVGTIVTGFVTKLPVVSSAPTDVTSSTVLSKSNADDLSRVEPLV